MYPPKKMILKVDFAIKLSKYTLQNESKRICPQYCILSSTTIHSRSLPLTYCMNKIANLQNLLEVGSVKILNLGNILFILLILRIRNTNFKCLNINFSHMNVARISLNYLFIYLCCIPLDLYIYQSMLYSDRYIYSSIFVLFRQTCIFIYLLCIMLNLYFYLSILDSTRSVYLFIYVLC